MSSDLDEFDSASDPGVAPPDANDDAHVDDDVCIAVSSAGGGGRKRRRDGSLLAAIVLSIGCHGALAVAWWQWGPVVQMPDFSISSGVGGTLGSGTTDDVSAAPPARAILPAMAEGTTERVDLATDLTDEPVMVADVEFARDGRCHASAAGDDRDGRRAAVDRAVAAGEQG